MRSGAVLALGLLLATQLSLGCELVESGPKHWVFACKGVRWWKIHEVFSSRTVYTSCPSKLTVGRDMGQDIRALRCIFNRHKGFQSKTGNQMTCLVEASPFRSGVIHIKGISSIGIVRNCEVQARIDRFSKPRLALFGIGALLLLVAKGLASSSHFRIGVGTLFIMFLGFLLLAATIFLRPTKIKSILTLFAASIFAMLLQFFSTTLYGQEFSILDLKWTYFGAAYLLISGLLGWMLCYYYDNAQDTRRISLVVQCVRLFGLTLMFASCSDLVAGVALVVSACSIQSLLSELGPRKGLTMLASVLSACLHLLPKLRGSHKKKRLTGKTKVGAARRKDNRDGTCEDLDSGSSLSEDECSDWEGDDTPRAMRKWCENCKRGYIINRTSNRTIGIGGATYQRLVEQGRTPNFREGFI